MLRAAAVRVPAVQRAGGRFAGDVHGAAPEAALGVALAVVEAVAGRLLGWLVQVARLRILLGRVEQGEAAAQGDDQALAVGALGQRGDFLVEVPAAASAVGRTVAVELAAQDVEPVERLFALRPDGAFAEFGAGVPDAARGVQDARRGQGGGCAQGMSPRGLGAPAARGGPDASAALSC
jgi:hypothetical protein